MSTTGHPMMTCGHAANATMTSKGGLRLSVPIACCAICGCVEIATREPDLTGRFARCSYQSSHPSDGKPPVPSSRDLAFFEYRGPGSATAELCRHCGYAPRAHEPAYMGTLVLVGGKRRPTVVEAGECPGYEPLTEGRETDSYYCGCRGWD